jgi:N-acetyl-1-D-myo-inositol-2-amino-2-deoxy-alpha-D-glucopyranoside deacetylase
MADQRIMFVHAHPDDESIGTGATMAKYAAAGAQVTLVTCTLGEEGEVIPPDLRHLAADRENRLGPHRIGELSAACAAMGVTDHRFLGGQGRWRDSGMMGAPTNDDPKCFWRADLDEAAESLIKIMREVRPQVIVSYDENGLYGHPDHIQAHRVTRRAFDLSKQAQTLFATAVASSELEAGLKAMDHRKTAFDRPSTPSDYGFGVPDEQITNRVDATAHLGAKLAALRAHRTQLVVDDPFFALSNGIGQRATGIECYTRLAGDPAAPDGLFSSGA